MIVTERDFETEKFDRKCDWKDAKTFKTAFLSILFLCQNYETFKVPTRAVFRPLTWNLLAL